MRVIGTYNLHTVSSAEFQFNMLPNQIKFKIQHVHSYKCKDSVLIYTTLVLLYCDKLHKLIHVCFTLVHYNVFGLKICSYGRINHTHARTHARARTHVRTRTHTHTHTYTSPKRKTLYRAC